jgi:nucleoside-diphosphate-sugar epimerase
VRKCIVTGGSGFVGIELCKRLHAEGVAVTIYDVSDPDDPELSGAVEFVRGDVRDAAALEAATRGSDTVFHIAAVVPLTRAGKGFEEINVGGTRNAVDAAVRTGAEHFVFLSSSAIYGAPTVAPIVEDTPTNPLGKYGRSKLEAERVAQGAREHGLGVSVIRPRTIIGPGRLGIFDLLFDWIRTGSPMFLIGSGKRPFQLVSNRDITDSMLLSARARSNRDFNVGTDRFTCLREDLNELAERVGSRSRVLGFPAWIARPALQTLDVLRLSPLVDFHYKTVDAEFWFDVSRIQDELGWQPQDSNVEMLEQAYRWYAEWREQAVQKGQSMHRSPLSRGLLRILSRGGS